MLTVALDVSCCGEVGMGILTIIITFQVEVDLGRGEIRAVPSFSGCIGFWVEPLSSRKDLSL